MTDSSGALQAIRGGALNAVSDSLKQAGARHFFTHRLDQRRSSDNDLVLLRQLASDGSFVRTVKCAPGHITVITQDKAGRLASFRRALLGEASDTPVLMRCGSRALHQSELNVVGRADHLWAQPSVAAVLEMAGAPATFISRFLSQIGLGDRLNDSPTSLRPSEVRRLQIASSFFMKSRVLVYDHLLDGLEPQWVDVVAKLMLDAAEASQRVFVVTGVKNIPAQWRMEPLVHLVTAEEELPNNEKPAPFDANSYSDRIRSLMHDSRAEEAPQAVITTRPQMIYPPRNFREDSLKAEAIWNPFVIAGGDDEGGIPEVLTPDMLKTASSRSDTKVGSLRKSPSGKLTRVTKPYRLRHRLTRYWSKLVDVLEVRSIKRSSGDGILGSARIKEVERKTKERERVLVLLALIFCALVAMLAR